MDENSWIELAQSGFTVKNTLETGQLVHNNPNPAPSSQEAFYDHGWHDLSFLGMAGSIYRGNLLGLALAIQCADVKARDLSKADMFLWQRRGRGWTLVDYTKDDLARRLMTRPNHTAMTWHELWRMTAIHYELAQNAYIYTPRNAMGDIIEFIPIPSPQCRMRVALSGAIYYEISAATEFDQAMIGDFYSVVPEREMLHFRGRILDGQQGLSSAILGSPIFGIVDAISKYQTKLFDNDGADILIFERDEAFPNSEMGEAAFRRLKRQLGERTQKAVRTGDPLLLEAGLTAKPISRSAKDSMTSEAFTQTVMRICGLMQTPPHKIFALEAATYNNMASMDRSYVQDCLLPTAINFETKMRNHMVAEADWPLYSCEFDRGVLIQNDPETLQKLLNTVMPNGVLTFDEAREILPWKLDPLKKGGDHRLIPVASAVVDGNGEVVQAATGQNPTQPKPGEEGSPDNNADKVVDLFRRGA